MKELLTLKDPEASAGTEAVRKETCPGPRGRPVILPHGVWGSCWHAKAMAWGPRGWLS